MMLIYHATAAVFSFSVSGAEMWPINCNREMLLCPRDGRGAVAYRSASRLMTDANGDAEAVAVAR